MTDKIISPGEDDEGPDSFVEEVREGLTNWYNATTTLREKIHDDTRMLVGGKAQWLPKDITQLEAEKRPVNSFNVIHPIVNFLTGYQIERDQDFRAYPRGPEDEQLGRLMTAIMKFGADIGRLKQAKHRQFRMGITGGISVMEIGHSYDYTDDLLNGDLTFNVLPENAFYWEPGARRYDFNDAAYCGKMLWYRLDEAKREWSKKAEHFDRLANRDWSGLDPELTGVPEQLQNELYDGEGDRVRILQHYYRTPVKVTLIVNSVTGEIQRMASEGAAEGFLRSVYDTAGRHTASQYQIVQANSQSALINQTTQQAHTFVTPDDAMRALDMVRKQASEQAADQFELVTRPTTALRVAHLTGWEQLDDKPSPYGSDWRIPFAIFTAYRDQDDLSSIKGVVRDITDAQREINWHHATMLDSLMRGPKSGVWLNKAEQKDIEKFRRTISRAGFVGEYAGTPPVPVVPSSVAQADMDMLQFGIQMIMQITGINAEMMGQTTQKTVSGRSIEARQAGGLVGVGSLLANWGETQQYMGELLVRRIQQYYPPEKMNQIIGQGQRVAQQLGMLGQIVIPDAMMFQQFQKLQNIDIDIVVGLQDVSATARQGIFTQMMQMMSSGFPIPPQLIVEASDIPYKQEVTTALQMQGMQPPQPDMAKAVSAGQGQSSPPSGVNKTA